MGRNADDVSIAKPKPGRPGGPDTLSPEQRDAYMKALGTPGMTMDLAALTANLEPRTIYKWLARGRRTANGKAAGDEPYRQFLQEATRAMGRAEAAALALIARAGQPRNITKTVKTTAGKKVTTTVTTEADAGDWRALAWILERRKAKKYGRRDHTTHAGDKDAPAVFVLDIPNPKEAAKREKADFGSDEEEGE